MAITKIHYLAIIKIENKSKGSQSRTSQLAQASLLTEADSVFGLRDNCAAGGWLNEDYNNFMTQPNQYAIVLWRLNLPQDLEVERITLQIVSFGESQFIKAQKLVKNHKVNFYRETLFIGSIQHGITFTVFLQNNTTKLASFPVSSSELSSVEKRPALFHLQKDGFELIWECCLFNGEASQIQLQTNKDYTQFEQSLQDNLSLLEFEFNSQAKEMHNLHDSDINRQDNALVKSLSTLESNDKQAKCKNWREEEDFVQDELDLRPDEHSKANSTRRIENSTRAMGNRQGKSHKIKSQLFSSMLSGFSGLFSSMKREE